MSALQYEGKRVIVTGAASGIGAATAQILVELGAEVHAIDVKKPDVPALASYTECDLRAPDQVDAAVRKIGAVVNALFNCEDVDVRHVTEAVIPNMIEGAAVVSVVSTLSEAINAYTTTRAAALAPQGIRINCVNVGPADAPAETRAWPLVFLNSPRASSLTGQQLDAT
jgi:NAD(P)-dependent dehydrogenase (short-subunit alcohol dehydrogenase family)